MNNSYDISKNGKSGKPRGRTRTSNPDDKISDDVKPQSSFKTVAEKKAKTGYDERRFIGINPTFYRGMKEKSCKIELFMLEGLDGFEARSTRSKMTEVIMRGSGKLKEWFYEKGANNELPEEWALFKKQVSDFCCERDISQLKKYKEESWEDFIMRVRDFATLQKIEGKEVLGI
ncbi:hypothetical protein EDEG_02546 [Edhazardia aedis USNM 41457]|uniref:Uncharacterized protein n=1 Tax=Edhazardia aedis (strain USNM 41457) TaxID=1003232 RepID=J9DNZ8_EDHAE|nr:hypothetical protein EDEG_02546 [Edhazardia aedis USNM 41457]|eukprot:EJW03067.1 hypothetical protein EDEG_02546 [Edhazardia aedis USNM 41457]